MLMERSGVYRYGEILVRDVRLVGLAKMVRALGSPCDVVRVEYLSEGGPRFLLLFFFFFLFAPRFFLCTGLDSGWYYVQGKHCHGVLVPLLRYRSLSPVFFYTLHSP